MCAEGDVKCLQKKAANRVEPRRPPRRVSEVFAGEHTTHPAVEFLQAERVRIEADDIVAYADGERIGQLPIDIEIMPGALSVFA